MADQLIYQSGWLSSFGCSGPPDTMFLFRESSPTPNYANSDTPIPNCGACPLAVPVGCCVSSIDLVNSVNYTSTTQNFVSDIYSLTPPIESNGYSYCTITPANNISLSGYDQAYYLANNQCIAGIMCDPLSDIISVFSNSDCSGSIEDFQLSDSLIQTSIVLGNFTVSLNRISNGTVKTNWLAISPQSELVPIYQSNMERLYAACYTLSALLCTITLCLSLKWFYSRRRTVDILFALSQVLFLSFLIVHFMYDNTAFYDIIEYSKYHISIQILEVYTLLTVYICCHLLFTILIEYKRYEIGVYVIFTLFYFGTMCYGILSDIYDIDEDYTTFYYFAELSSQMPIYWKIVYIAMRIIPSILIQWKIFSGASQNKVVKAREKIKVLLALTIIQVGIIIIYEVLQILSFDTLIWRNDRDFLANKSTVYLLEALNFLLVFIIYEKLVDVIGIMVRKIPKIVEAADAKTKQFTHTINLHPQYFGRQIKEFLIQRLYAEVEGTCSGRYGFIISVVDIVDIGKGVLQSNTGFAEYRIEYKAIVFKPFRNEVFDGIVTTVNKVGFWCEVGPLQVFISQHLIPEYLQFDPNANPAAYVGKGEEFGDAGVRIEKGEAVRIRISGTRVEATAIFATGTLKEDYLGPSQLAQ
ncbi:DNA-directed RNA polymerase II subunit [Boothiomyces sp. JEL0866]|nr:DNA-directed RNA polymerase II subunit [Boothiomyces sp. JEL0866]